MTRPLRIAAGLAACAALAGGIAPRAGAQNNDAPPAPVNSAAGAPFRRGVDAYKRGELETALREMEAAVAADAKNADALSWLGFLLVKGNRTAEAVAPLERAIALRPDADTYNNLGNALLQQKQTERALGMFRKATEASPRSAQAHFNQGVAHARLGQYAEAAQSYRRATELSPQDAKAWTNLASALQQTKRMDEAAQAWRQAGTLSPDDPAIWTNLGVVEMARRNTAGTTAAFEKARALAPKNADVLMALGRVYAESNRPLEAAAVFGEAADLKADDPLPRYNQGVLLAQAGRLPEAVAAYEKALVIRPRYFDALINLGTILYGTKNRSDEAVTRFREAVGVQPASALAHANLAAALSKRGDEGDEVAAAGEWRKAAALDPKDSDSRSFLASYLLAQKNPAVGEATQLLKEAVALNPTPENHNDLGLAYQQAGKLDQAAASYRKAIALKPGYADPYNNLGVVYERRGQRSEAIANYKKALALNPKLIDAQRNLDRFNPKPKKP